MTTQDLNDDYAQVLFWHTEAGIAPADCRCPFHTNIHPAVSATEIVLAHGDMAVTRWLAEIETRRGYGIEPDCLSNATVLSQVRSNEGGPHWLDYARATARQALVRGDRLVDGTEMRWVGWINKTVLTRNLLIARAMVEAGIW